VVNNQHKHTPSRQSAFPLLHKHIRNRFRNAGIITCDREITRACVNYILYEGVKKAIYDSRFVSQAAID